MKRVRQYLEAMTASAIDSAVNAVVVFIGASGISVETGGQALELRTLGGMFLTAFALAVLKYVNAHPIAAEVERLQMDTTTTTEATSAAPKSTVKQSLTVETPVKETVTTDATGTIVKP